MEEGEPSIENSKVIVRKLFLFLVKFIAWEIEREEETEGGREHIEETNRGSRKLLHCMYKSKDHLLIVCE